MTTLTRRLLVIYTGGTIGMVPAEHGLVPEVGMLAQRIAELPQFHDASQPPLTLPGSTRARIRYEVLELAPLVDSACMATSHWVAIARTIEQHYNDYDAFVVLHGTDTMAYTASALSFMLVNNAKTVILTGSQMPLSRSRNDAVDNLLGALTVAGTYDIPEVGLYFRDRLLRGNRSRKVDAAQLDAFTSGNLRPLANVGIGIDVDWDLVRAPEGGAFRVRPITERNVAALRLFPGMTLDLLRRFLQPPLRGLVLETYGAGNAPNDPEFLGLLEEATDRGIVIVNVTQCLRGSVTEDYATGKALRRSGVTSGHDLTPEAALTKLAYLLSLDLSVEEVRAALEMDIRGELTPTAHQPETRFPERDLVRNVAHELEGDRFRQLGSRLYPMLMCAAAREGDLQALARMVAAGADPGIPGPDERTALHVAASEGRTHVVRWLLRQGVRVDVHDRWGHTPHSEARGAGHAEVLSLLDLALRV